MLDFGLARTDGLASAYAPNPTHSGAILGTVGFMPPEQAGGHTDRIDERSDLWAVAAVLFTMLTGKRLHSATRSVDALQRASGESAPPIRSVRSSVPEVVARVVDRGLAREPKERFQSGERMQGALRFALNEIQSPGQSPAPFLSPSAELSRSAERPSARPARSQRRGLTHSTIGMGVLVLAALAGLAGLAWVASFSLRL